MHFSFYQLLSQHLLLWWPWNQNSDSDLSYFPNRIRMPKPTPLTRAVIFSALATGSAFGALWLSDHPGTASMGLILMISLIWTLVCALIFEPALLGMTPTQVALAWLLRRAPNVILIPGTSSRVHLRETLAVAAAGLQDEALATLDSIRIHTENP